MSFKVFKTSQPILLQIRLTEYLIKTNGKNVMTRPLTLFMENLDKNYQALTNLQGSSSSQSFLSQTKQTAINYLYQLELLLSKLTISDLNTFDIGFNWTDTLSQTVKKSNNLWFEYYCVMYNVGIMYYNIGHSCIKDKLMDLNPDEAKTIRGYFCNALYYFDKIKNEIGTKLNEDEKGIDLTEDGLNYMRNLCIMGGYIALMNFSYCKYKQNVSLVNTYEDFTKLNIDTNLKQRLSIMNEIVIYAEYIIKYLETLSTSDKLLIAYYEYTRDYFKAFIEYFQYEFNYFKHEYEGGRIGKAITYMKRHLEMVNELEAKLPMLGNLVQGTKLKIGKEECETKLQEMIKINNAIRNSTIVPPNQIERTELKITAMDPEDKHNLESFSENDLISIISPEMQNKLKAVYKELTTYLNNQYKLYLDDKSIEEKILNLKYPIAIASMLNKTKPNTITTINENDLIWRKISYIQKINCTQAIENLFKILFDKNKTLKSLLSEVIVLLEQEKIKDGNYRMQFGFDWKLKPSSADSYIKFTQERINKLSIFNIRCTEFESECYQHANSFNSLKITLQELQEKLPGNIKIKSMVLNEEEKKIVEAVTMINQLKDTLKKEKIKVLSEMKNTGIILSGYESILNGKLKEIDFIAQQKERVNQLLIKYIKPISIKINECLSTLITQCAKVCASPNEIARQQEIENENKKCIDQYQSIIDTYFEKLLKVHNGYTAMINNTNKLNKGLNSLYSYLALREKETNQMLEMITKTNLTHEEVKQRPNLEQEFPLQQYKDMVNDIAQLGVDVSVFASKIGELTF